MSLITAMSAGLTPRVRRLVRGAPVSWERRVAPLAAFLLLLLLLLVFAAACVPIDPDPLLDSEGDPIDLPGPADRWLEVISSAPSSGNVELRPRFAFIFNDYLDEDSFKSYNFATLNSGGISASGRAFYRMSDKTVVWRPNSKLEPGLIYRLKITPSLKSATGAPFLQRSPGDPAGSASRVFIPSTANIPEVDATLTERLPDAAWPEVEAIFDASCASCHADPDWQLNPLTYAQLIRASSTQADLFLVQPGNPSGSYLMRKILWDYPDLKFTPQPPPWSDNAQELSREDLLTIEGWIAHGARR